MRSCCFDTANRHIASVPARTRKSARRVRKTRQAPVGFQSFLLATALTLTVAGWWFRDHYILTFQSPVRLQFQSPIVVAERVISGDAAEAQADQQGRRLSAWQQYACRKFGSDCRLALAIQRAQNNFLFPWVP